MYIGLVMLGRQKYIQQKHQSPELSNFEFETVIEKLKRHKPPGNVTLSTELIKPGGGGRKIRPDI